MYRNSYDTDCVTWSPQGRIYQIEYAMEAVKQGTCVVGVCGKDYVVLCGSRRAVSNLAAYNRKIAKIDEHIGVAFSGITADATILIASMRESCLNYKYTYGKPMPAAAVVAKEAKRSQANTQKVGKRPFGVGLLIAAYDDEDGPTLSELCPSGNVYEFRCQAFGSRCQSARTYLENNLSEFENASLDQLVIHSLKSLAVSMTSDVEFKGEGIHLCVVGKDMPYREYETEEIQRVIDAEKITSPVKAHTFDMDLD